MEFLSIIIWILCGVGCMKLAENKNRNQGLAFVMGCLFGVFALVFYLLIGNSKD